MYILKSLKDGKFYTGYTSNLVKRIESHNRGSNKSTKHRRPLELVYAESVDTKREAIERERFLKSLKGSYLKTQLKAHFGEVAEPSWSV